MTLLPNGEIENQDCFATHCFLHLVAEYDVHYYVKLQCPTCLHNLHPNRDIAVLFRLAIRVQMIINQFFENCRIMSVCTGYDDRERDTISTATT